MYKPGTRVVWGHSEHTVEYTMVVNGQLMLKFDDVAELVSAKVVETTVARYSVSVDCFSHE
jgi:uncharacterized cupin superfamily protein